MFGQLRNPRRCRSTSRAHVANQLIEFLLQVSERGARELWSLGANAACREQLPDLCGCVDLEPGCWCHCWMPLQGAAVGSLWRCALWSVLLGSAGAAAIFHMTEHVDVMGPMCLKHAQG